MKVKRSSSTHVKPQQHQSTPKKSSVKGCGSSKKSGQKQGKIKFEPSTPIFYNQNSNSCSNDTTLSSAASSSNTLVADTPSQAQAQVQTKEAKVRSLLKELQVHVRHINQERAKNEPNLTTIVKTHERVKKEDKITKFFRNKLRSMYTAAMKESENEIKCLREALDCINQIRHTQNEIRILQQQLQQQQLLHQTSPSSSALLHPCAADAALNHHMYLGSLAQSYHDEALSKTGAATNSTMRRGVLMSILQQAALTLPLWVGEIGQPAPPLCGSTPPEPFYMCKIGDKVAALIKNNTNNTTITAATTTTKSKNKKSKNAAAALDTTLNGTVGGAANEEPGEEEENWILAEVVGFNQHQGRYEVDDVDAPEGQERHSLGKRRVVPLPLWRANPLTDPQAIFPKDSFVLALYPQTTCFYRGIVYEAPQTPQDDYQVLFEDNTYPEGYSPPLLVPQLYVVADRCNKNK